MIWIQGTAFGNWVKSDGCLQNNTTPCRSQDWFDWPSIAFVRKTGALLVWFYFLGEIIREAGKTSSTRNWRSTQLLGPAGRWHIRIMTAQGHASHCCFPCARGPPPFPGGRRTVMQHPGSSCPSARCIISGLMIRTYGNGTGTTAFTRVSHSHVFCSGTTWFRFG